MLMKKALLANKLKKTKKKDKKVAPVAPAAARELAGRWLRDHRRRGVHAAYVADEYDLWPLLVETVRARAMIQGKKLIFQGKELSVVDYSRNIRLRGRMREYLLKHMDDPQLVPKAPVFRRLATESELVTLHKAARDLQLQKRHLHRIESDGDGEVEEAGGEALDSTRKEQGQSARHQKRGGKRR